MTISQFIQKAIEGGYKHSNYNLQKIVDDGMEESPSLIKELVINPEVWRAVGKIEGWDNAECDGKILDDKNHYQVKMHQMIDFLADGRSIEYFIKTL